MARIELATLRFPIVKLLSLPGSPSVADLPNDQRSIDRLTEADVNRSARVIRLVLENWPDGSRKWRLKFLAGRGAARKLKTWTIGDARKIAIGKA